MLSHEAAHGSHKYKTAPSLTFSAILSPDYLRRRPKATNEANPVAPDGVSFVLQNKMVFLLFCPV